MCLLPVAGANPALLGQAASAASTAPAAPTRYIGTIKSLSGNAVSLQTDQGMMVNVTVADGARILQLAPGSTDLKSATAIALTDVSVGDRVLVTGKAGDTPTDFNAVRLILMKATDIAQKHAQEEQAWQQHGSGGLVVSVDAAASALTITAGAKKTLIRTTPATIFRRYAGDSVKFEDATKSEFSSIQPGDQLRVLGTKSDDGATIDADEIVSGSFKNLSGTIATLDAAGGSLTLKDLATKKMVTVKVTANSAVKSLPPFAAQMLAARAHGGAAAGAAGGPGGARGMAESGGGATPARPGGAWPGAGQAAAGQGSAGPGSTGPAAGPGAGRVAGGDLSQIVARLPSAMLSSLHVGDAVMIVASQSAPGASSLTAITLLSGVEPILAASPNGSSAMTLSPWSLGSNGMAEAGTQ
ncbi:MAG: hypothetical protein KGK08_10000 [Acidobacteriota bacterium]|nr:hypothetical protein [Acidobacteriota bacterium]